MSIFLAIYCIDTYYHTLTVNTVATWLTSTRVLLQAGGNLPAPKEKLRRCYFRECQRVVSNQLKLWNVESSSCSSDGKLIWMIELFDFCLAATNCAIYQDRSTWTQPTVHNNLNQGFLYCSMYKISCCKCLLTNQHEKTATDRPKTSFSLVIYFSC